jgi:hypothetical protein
MSPVRKGRGMGFFVTVSGDNRHFRQATHLPMMETIGKAEPGGIAAVSSEGATAQGPA